MKTKLKVAITIRDDLSIDQMFAGNGYSQNIKFFYDMLKLMGHKPYLLVTRKPETERLVYHRKNYRPVYYDELFQPSNKMDIVFEAGVSIAPAVRQKLREQFGSKIVSIRYGHSMIMDMENLFLKQTMTPGIHFADPDVLWTSPHLASGATYLETVYNCPVLIAPYIWEPDFLKGRFSTADYEQIHKPDIYVMEPNISVLKNALIPMAIIEQVYRQQPDSFGRATILNGLGFNQQDFFLENIVRHMSSLISHANKVYFSARATFEEVFKRPDILLGHQWNCELNYLYLEALYKGVPLVHNSPSLSEVGFYYPDFDVHEGAKACMSAIKSINKPSNRKKIDAFLHQFSIKNIHVQKTYADLIDSVMEA